jgi:ribosome modulation factor
MNSKFIDLLEKCGCSEKGKCDCKEKGKKCTCKEKCKNKEIRESDTVTPAERAGFKAGESGSQRKCPDIWVERGKENEWLDGYDDAEADRGRGMKESKYADLKQSKCKKCGQVSSKTVCPACGNVKPEIVNENKKDDEDDERGDWKYHQKKDDKLGDKSSCCGSTKGFIKMKDGKLKCIGCGKVTEKKLKESKFEKYLIEQEAQNHLFESVVAIDPSNKEGAKFLDELGLDAYSLDPKTTITALAKYFKGKNMSDDKILSFLKGIGFLKINDDDVRKMFNDNAMSNMPTGKGLDPRASRNN